MKYISPLLFIVAIVYSYISQKRCDGSWLKFKGKKIVRGKKVCTFAIIEAFVDHGVYYARGIIRETGEVQTIKIDKQMMAAVPDNTRNNSSEPVIDVLVYQEGPDNNPTFGLAEEEIRFKLNIQIIRDSEPVEEEIEHAKSAMGFIYEIRVVLLTLACVGIYRSPTISIICSLAAFALSFRNIMPFRFKNLYECGIISTKEESATKSNDATKKVPDTVPPGYDNWSDDRKFIFDANERLKKSMEKPEEHHAMETQSNLDSEIDGALPVPPPIQEEDTAQGMESKKVDESRDASTESYEEPIKETTLAANGMKSESTISEDEIPLVDNHEGEDPFSDVEDVEITEDEILPNFDDYSDENGLDDLIENKDLPTVDTGGDIAAPLERGVPPVSANPELRTGRGRAGKRSVSNILEQLK